MSTATLPTASSKKTLDLVPKAKSLAKTNTKEKTEIAYYFCSLIVTSSLLKFQNK